MTVLRQFALASWILLGGAVASDLAAQRGPAAGETYMVTVASVSREAREQAAEGQRLMDMGRYREANERFRQATETDPGFALAWLHAASTSTATGEYRRSLETATRLRGSASEPERLLIDIANRGLAGDVEGQLELARRLTQVQAGNPRAWSALATVQLTAGQVAEARASLAQAARVAPRFGPVQIGLATAWLREPRDPGRALAAAQRAVSLAPDSPLAYDLLGDAYRARGELARAREAYTRQAALDPGSGLPLQQRGHVHTFLGSWDAARADYDAAISLATGPERAAYGVWRALVRVHAGEPAAAVAELQRHVAEVDRLGVPEPEEAKVFALAEMATIAIHHRMFEAAERALAQRASLLRVIGDRLGREEVRRRQEASVAYYRGLLAAHRGDFAEARAQVDELRRQMEGIRDPRKDQPVHELLGMIALFRGDHAEAAPHLGEADPDDIYVTYHRAVALAGAGRVEEARALFRKVASHNFNSARAALVRGEARKKLM